MENNQYTQNELAEMFNVNTFVIREIKRGKNWKYISDLYDFTNYTKYDWSSADEEKVRKICEDIVSNLYTSKEIAARHNVNQDVVQRIRHGESFKNIVSKYDFSKNTTIKMKNKDLKYQILELMREGKSNSEIKSIVNFGNIKNINKRLSEIRKLL